MQENLIKKKTMYNIIKTMKDPNTGKTISLLLLDGLSEILEVKELGPCNEYGGNI